MPPPHSYIPDEIYYPAPPPPPQSQPSTADSNIYHIIFLPGNPGCIAYYQLFLATLHQQLNSSSASPTSSSFARLAIYARSLRGFEVNQSSHHSPLTARFKQGPWGLQAEIEFAEALVQSYISRLASKPVTATSSKQKQKVKLILIGHSLGTYIILELLRRRNERVRTARQRGEWCRDAEADILAAILLFPTVVDIAASPNGKTIGRVAGLPYAAAVVNAFAALLVRALGLIGAAAVVAVVQWVTRMPDDAAAVTAAWLSTRRAVYQSLHLARDEMREMTEDKWDEEIWGVAADGVNVEANAEQSGTKLFFYYSQKDHWIANHTRDELIAARGRRKRRDDDTDTADEGAGESRPIMEIDEGDVPHGFCIRHSVPIAQKTAEYIRQVIMQQ